MDKNEVSDIIYSAMTELVENDRDILEININERTISHRLAIYLEKYFDGWSVDCEYNRDHDDKKTLHIFPERTLTNDTEANTVFPDIIVHERRTNKNLLVIEIKKSSNNNETERSKDIEKLKAFKRELGYMFAVFIDIGVVEKVGENSAEFK
jgi:hypothetical protein